jgi:hypothetical protein
MARLRREAMARGRGAGADLGVVLAKRAGPHVAQEVLDAPVASDTGGEFGAGGVEDAQAGDQVDALDGQLPGAQVASPPYDLDRLAGAGVVEVAERGDLESADLLAVVSVVAGAVPERDVPPGQLPDLGVHARMVLLYDDHVVRASTGQIGPMIVLGVQGVGGHHGVL